MSLGSRDIVEGVKRHGLRREIVAVAVVIVFGIVDQFTARIIPGAADAMQDFFFPPKFVIGFKPPVKTQGALTVNRLEYPAAHPVSVEPIKGTDAVVAFGGAGLYELKLIRQRNSIEEWLVERQEIAKGKTWEVDTTDRNWAAATAYLESGSSGHAQDNSRKNADEAPLRGTRWSVTREDFARIATADDAVLRSMLANALADAGTFEHGTEREKQRILSYWTATGLEELARKQRLPWAGAFLAWAARQAGAPVPRGSAAFMSWHAWGEPVPADAVGAGMVALFKMPGGNDYGGIVLRQSADCIEVVAGNVANRVAVTCVPRSNLVAVRRPQPSDPPAASSR